MKLKDFLWEVLGWAGVFLLIWGFGWLNLGYDWAGVY